MKKVFLLLIVMGLFLVFTACNSGATNSSESNTGSNTESTSVNDSLPEIKWTTYSSTKDLPGGYTVEYTIRLSPWILLSNTDMINKAWDEICSRSTKDKVLPGFDDWGLTKYSNGYSRNGMEHFYKYTMDHAGFGGGNMNDMYYCMGSIYIKNITENWSFDETNSHNVLTQIGIYTQQEDSEEEAKYLESICRVFYANSNVDYAYGIRLSPKMTHDETYLPFVVMTGEIFSPNSPDGAGYERVRRSYFSIEPTLRVPSDEIIRVGIIGKDGKYVPPELGNE